MSQAFEQLNEYLEKAQALKTALVLFEWDDATLAPKEAGTYTSRMVGVLSSEYQKTMSNPQVKELVEQCGEDNSHSIQYCPRGKKGIRTSGVHSAGRIP